MKLWVRSQDKECLMKINRIDYDLSNGEHRIMVDGYKTLIGKYKTKERALEVLDEIQNFMLCNREYKYTTIASINELGSCYIYQMPDE